MLIIFGVGLGALGLLFGLSGELLVAVPLRPVAFPVLLNCSKLVGGHMRRLHARAPQLALAAVRKGFESFI